MQLKQVQEQAQVLIATSAVMKKVLAECTMVATTNASVLLKGETGTGKEVLAGFIRRSSRREKAAFIKLNCAALPESLLESELFGHERGAFTGANAAYPGRFEQADNGTLFLDEIGDMSANTQAKILRVLQEQEIQRVGSTETRKVDVRVIAATSRNLEKMITHGTFRADLLYRLNTFEVEIPPLRSRRQDIPELATHYMQLYAGTMDKQVSMITDEAMALLQQYPWPGNIRQLQNVIRRSIITTKTDMITPEDLVFQAVGSLDEGPILMLPEHGMKLEDIERWAIFQTLELAGGNKTRAASWLGISIKTLHNKLNQYKKMEGGN